MFQFPFLVVLRCFSAVFSIVKCYLTQKCELLRDDELDVSLCANRGLEPNRILQLIIAWTAFVDRCDWSSRVLQER